MKLVLAIVIAVCALAGRAEAYPQFQLSFDQTCTGCHLSPDGGGLLSENGIMTAEMISQWGTNPEFMYGVIDPPEWLVIGGDFRGMAGYLKTPQRYLYAFPMQADVYGAVYKGGFSLHATAGLRPARPDEPLTRVWAREHFVQWQSEAGASEGLWVRAGQFMPVFGLRLAEHPAYTRRYGGTPLYAETYGVSASLVKAKYEAHASGFIDNPLTESVLRSSGGALYGELRLAEKTLVGGGAMLTVSDFEHKYRGALTAKHYLASPGILLQAEVQLVNPHVGDFGYKQVVGYLMGSYFVTDAILVDLGIGHYDENLRIADLDRNSIDLNVHWFVTSHFEAVLVTRYEAIGQGRGGPSGGFAFLQAHYRL